jgi:hypothetical protein
MTPGPDRITEILYEFVCSGRQESIHNAIAAFGNLRLPASTSLMDKIKLLIHENEV